MFALNCKIFAGTYIDGDIFFFTEVPEADTWINIVCSTLSNGSNSRFAEAAVDSDRFAPERAVKENSKVSGKILLRHRETKPTFRAHEDYSNNDDETRHARETTSIVRQRNLQK